MLKKILFLLTLSLCAFVPLYLAKAAITNSSRVIPYQGRLTDSSGNNVADGTYAMTFKIYTVSTGGSASFTETFSAGNSVTVTSGLFSVLLGSLSANGVNLDFANPPYYLGIAVAANSEMTPRIQLGFAPLAHNAQYLDGTPLSSLALASSVVIDNSLANGRLTLTSGTPVTTSDVTAATTVYYTPYNGNRISLYDGSSTWSTLTFSELSLSLSGYTANKNYDIFAYNNSGTVALESLVWTNDTTRATAVVLQDGIYVKSGATTRRLLGTIRITGTTGQTEDSRKNRLVANLSNAVYRSIGFNYTSSWSESGSTSYWIYYGNDSSQFVGVIRPTNDNMVSLNSVSTAKGTNGSGYQYVNMSVSIDSLGTIVDQVTSRGAYNPTYGLPNGTNSQMETTFNGYPGIGYRKIIPSFYVQLHAAYGGSLSINVDDSGIQSKGGSNGFVVQ